MANKSVLESVAAVEEKVGALETPKTARYAPELVKVSCSCVIHNCKVVLTCGTNNRVAFVVRAGVKALCAQQSLAMYAPRKLAYLAARSNDHASCDLAMALWSTVVLWCSSMALQSLAPSPLHHS